MHDYLLEALASFVNDPADTDYQRGYLAALLNVAKELDICIPHATELFAQIKAERV